MSRLQAIDPASTTGRTEAMLEGVKNQLGRIPNLIRTFANAEVVLETYLGFSTLGNGALLAPLREQIALTVAELNECDYCLAAHTAIGKMVGLTDQQILDSREGSSVDRQEEAALQFARAVVEKKGRVSDADLSQVREAGYNDGEIAEIVANVVNNIFTNYFNHVAETEVDFPQAPALAAH